MNLRPGRHERNTFDRSLSKTATETLKHVFLGTAAASSLLLAVAAVEPAGFSLTTRAQAATNIAAGVSFHDELAPYGNWASYQNRSVWVPANVEENWQPYTKGHWAYTRRYGWIWVSDERFGWATYHYGRWGKAPDIGWYWVPGRRWAPAWVAWSYDHYDLAWAPLPPVHYDGVNDAISLGDIPDDYWQAISVSAFLSVDLSSHIFRDRDKVRRVIQRGKSWTVSIENNIVVNNVITIDNIEKRTKKKVVALEEKPVDNPGAAGKADSNSVAIFKPEMKEEPAAKPKETIKVEEVVKEREAKGIPQQARPEQTATTTDEPVEESKIIPSFDTVQVEPTGETLIAGRAEPGSEVVVKFNGMTVGTAVANADGAFVITPDKPLPSGPGALSIESKSNGVVVASANSVAVDVKAGAVDTPRAVELKQVIQAPAVPKPALPPSKTVSLDTVAYDQSGNIVFSGRGPVDSEVQLYVDNNPYGLAGINDKGTWTFAGLFPLTVGTHTLRAQEIGRDGAVKSRIEMPFYREDPAKVASAPVAPTKLEAPKPAVVATAQEVLAATPPVDSKKKKDAARPDQQAADKSAQPAEKATASIDQPKIEKAVEAPTEKQAALIEMKKKETTASIDQLDVEKIVEAPVVEPKVPVEEKKKKEATASTDQPKIEKTLEAPAEKQAAPVEIKKKKAAAAPDQKAVKTSALEPAKEQAVPVDRKKTSKLSKLKNQSTKRVVLKTNLPDAGAESWRVRCSPRFEGLSNASETFISSAGKRVSCASRPTNARAKAEAIFLKYSGRSDK